MASAVFFLDLKGKASQPGRKSFSKRGAERTTCANISSQTLLARNYRGDIPMSAVEKFPILLSEAEEESSAVPPCFSDEGINVKISHKACSQTAP
jgi:AP-1 complex subunit mu